MHQNGVEFTFRIDEFDVQGFSPLLNISAILLNIL